MASENYTNHSSDYLNYLEAFLREFIRNKTLRREQQQEEHQPGPTEQNLEITTYEEMALSFEWRTTLICAFSVNIALSIVGNIGVIIVLLVGRSKTVLNRFLINLAVADLTMAIFCMPFTFPTIMYGHWIFSAGMCPTVIFLQHVSVFVSVYTLAIIGIDRYMAIMWPLKARVTKNRVKVLIASIWLASVPLGSVQAAYAQAKPFNYGEEVVYLCTEWWPSTAAETVHEICIVLITYCLPLSALLFAYFRIGRKLWGRKPPGNPDRQRDKMYYNNKKKVIKMLIVVVLIFTVCWLPLQVFNLIEMFSPYIFDDHDRQNTLRKVNACVLWLAMSNSFMNPIIYTFLNDTFRVDVKEIVMRCGLCCSPEKSPCTCQRSRKRLFSLPNLYSNGTGMSTNTRRRSSDSRRPKLSLITKEKSDTFAA
ncbi:prolactin-releasing peptide receptor-like [Ptychodera flava]|uniref:prolactin-releasing peptide receptor-like n=1 Tax=Ptychodera flava TaxID=63121 RepID=UPI00396AB179